MHLHTVCLQEDIPYQLGQKKELFPLKSPASLLRTDPIFQAGLLLPVQ